MRDSQFLLRLKPDVKKRLKMLAATLDISMTELINQLILERLDMEKEHAIQNIISQGRGRFGGVFASKSEAVAESHGDYIYELSVESSRIAESCDLEGISSSSLEKMFPWLSKIDSQDGS